MKYLKKGFEVIFVVMLVGCSSVKKNPSTTFVPVQSHDRCNQIYSYDLGSRDFQRMDAILEQIAHETGCFIEYSDPKISSMKPHPVIGRMSIRQAVLTAIQGTPIQFKDVAPGELSLHLPHH
ncbi:MAG: hypothetical protein CENE_01602 [Candidatus Celerinatantimonas neptuna]|nr:MAG: hypothetical protein CENE_01602 [Candidatus Celerinatantimonas neptuna]